MSGRNQNKKHILSDFEKRRKKTKKADAATMSPEKTAIVISKTAGTQKKNTKHKLNLHLTLKVTLALQQTLCSHAQTQL